MTTTTNERHDIGRIIADVIADEATARGLTHADLATATGIPETTLADIFDGTMEINVSELTALAIALGSKPSVFVKRAEQIRGEVA